MKKTLLIFFTMVFMISSIRVNAMKYIDGRFILNVEAQRAILKHSDIPLFRRGEKNEDFKFEEQKIAFCFFVNIKGKVTRISIDEPIINKKLNTIDRLSAMYVIPKFEITPYDAVKLLRYENKFPEDQFIYESIFDKGCKNDESIFIELEGITEENYLDNAGVPESGDYSSGEYYDCISEDEEYNSYRCNLKFFEIVPGEKVFVAVYDDD